MLSQASATLSASVNAAGRNASVIALMICCGFVGCWSLNEISYTLDIIGIHKMDFSGWYYHFTVVMVLLSSCINPFITPPSIVISRRASERWWRRTAAVLQRQVEHTVDHHHISRTLCYTVNVIAVTCTSEMWLWLWGVTVPMQHWQIRLTNRTSSYYGRMTRLRLILQWHLCRTLLCRISTFTLFVCQIRKIQTTQLHSTYWSQLLRTVSYLTQRHRVDLLIGKHRPGP